MASDLPSSITPLMPNIRPSPVSGFILFGLNPIALQRKPSEPRIAGVPIAATSVIANSEASGKATAAASR